MEEIKELKVSKSTEPKKLAGTLKYYILEGKSCSLFALGSQAICISVKSIALLTSMFGLEYSCRIDYFTQLNKDGKVSGIKFTIQP